MTQQNAAMVEEGTAATRALAADPAELAQEMTRFKLSGAKSAVTAATPAALVHRILDHAAKAGC